MRRHLASFALIGLGLLWPVPAAGQSQPATAVVPVSEETTLVAQGWAMLGAGDASAAAERARVVLDKYPQSVAGLALAVEADIVRGRGVAGLNTYESWLGTRKLDSPYLVRRIAFAYLREAAASKDPRSRLAALKALAAEGDAEALAALAEASRKGQLAETKVMASLGDDNAVRVLGAQLEQAIDPLKLTYIDALAATHNKLAVPPLAKLLDHKDPFLVAAAIDAIGKIGAPEMIPRLRPLVQEGRPGPVRWQAAVALARMGDAGGVTFLRQQLVSELSNMLQIQAAEGLSYLGPNSDWIDTARRLAVSGDTQVRLLAAKVIAPYDNALAKSTLDGLMNDLNPGVREGATDALASRVAGDFATLRRLLRSPDAYAAVLAAGRIAELTR